MFHYHIFIITGYLTDNGAAGTADDGVPEIAVWHFYRGAGKIGFFAFWAYWRFNHNKPPIYSTKKNGTITISYN